MSVSREEIITIAQAIIKEQIDVIQGCRMLVPYINAAGLANDPDGIVIRGFESETDDLPVGDERAQWVPEVLAQKDQLRQEYISRAGSDVVEACRSIVAKLSAS